MNKSRFKNLRHIETVRNYINSIIVALLDRGEQHDQSKLRFPEAIIFAEQDSRLTYGSDEYMNNLDLGLGDALEHHYSVNRHHPQHHTNGIRDMDLIDLVEMICDWKAATLQHNDSDILKSIEINQNRFGYSDELKAILINTAKRLNESGTRHYADESK
jgi:hypothetical protein